MFYINETIKKNIFEKIDQYHLMLLQLLRYSNSNQNNKSLSSFTSYIIPALSGLSVNYSITSLNNLINQRNDKLFKNHQLTFIPYKSENAERPTISEVFKKIQSTPLSFFISITDGWYNIQVYNGKKWEYLENKKGGLLWYDQTRDYPWGVALKSFADRFEKPFEKLKDTVYIVISNFEEGNDRFSYNEFINRLESVNDGYHLLYSDNEGLEKFYPGTSIFYLGWENLVTIVPTAHGRICRVIPSMGIGKFLSTRLNLNPVMAKHFAYIGKRMLTEENDEQADALGITDHRIKMPLILLKGAIKNYIDELSPALPEQRFVRFEGWFNSRLFHTLLLNYGFSASANLGLTNILNPWHSTIASETPNG